MRAPASAYESVAATTIKIIANESIAIGMRPIKPALENLNPPGMRRRVP